MSYPTGSHYFQTIASSADVSGSLPPFSLPPLTCCLLVLQPTAYGQHSAKQKTPVCRGTWRDGQPTELTREPGSLSDPLARRIARWSENRHMSCGRRLLSRRRVWISSLRIYKERVSIGSRAREKPKRNSKLHPTRSHVRSLST
jgi:hypothetical protein